MSNKSIDYLESIETEDIFYDIFIMSYIGILGLYQINQNNNLLRLQLKKYRQVLNAVSDESIDVYYMINKLYKNKEIRLNYGVQLISYYQMFRDPNFTLALKKEDIKQTLRKLPNYVYRRLNGQIKFIYKAYINDVLSLTETVNKFYSYCKREGISNIDFYQFARRMKRKDYSDNEPNEIIITEGFSNYENILDDLLYYVQEKIKELDGKKIKNTRTINYKHKIKIENDKEIIVHVKLDPKIYARESAITYLTMNLGIRGLLDKSILKIKDNKSEFDEVMSVVAHEITHYSQRKNKFFNWDKEVLKSISKKKFGDISTGTYYKSLGGHAESPTEHESRLIEFFTLIKRKSFKNAWILFERDYSEYFSGFNKKQILSKMYDFGIDYRKEYKQFQDYVDGILLNNLKIWCKDERLDIYIGKFNYFTKLGVKTFNNYMLFSNEFINKIKSLFTPENIKNAQEFNKSDRMKKLFLDAISGVELL